MSFNLPTSINTAAPAIPAIADAARVKIPGAPLMMVDMIEWCGSDGLGGALAVERANIAGGSPIWRDQTIVRIAIEGVIERLWNATAAHARLVVFPNGATTPLQGDRNTVTATSGAPTGGTPLSGDKRWDQATGLLYSYITVWDAGVALPGGGGSGGVPTTRTVAGKPLSADVVLVKGDVGLGNVDNTSDAAKPVSTAQATALALLAPLASPALTGAPSAPTPASTDNTTRLATTAMVQAALSAAVAGLLDLKTSLDASATPSYPAALKGDTYIVSAAGKIGGASGKAVDVGDIVVASADNAGGLEAAAGTSWFVMEHNLVGAMLAANNGSDIANTAAFWTALGGDAKAQAALASALATKISDPGTFTLGSVATPITSGAAQITHALHANRVGNVAQSGATTAVFAAAATSGAVARDTVYILNDGTGTLTATGTITAPLGYTLVAPPGTALTADYSAAVDAWFSTTLASAQSAVAASNVARADLHFETWAAFQAAVAAEQARVAANDARWEDGARRHVGVAPNVVTMIWSVANNHARLASFGSGKTLLLGSGTSVVLFASGVPASGTGANGDASVDWAVGVYGPKAAGAWPATPAVTFGNAATTTLAVALAVQNAAPSNIELNFPEPMFQGSIPPATAFTNSKSAAPWNPTALAWNTPTQALMTMPSNATSTDTILSTFVEGLGPRFATLAGNVPLLSFAAKAVANNVSSVIMEDYFDSLLTGGGTASMNGRTPDTNNNEAHVWAGGGGGDYTQKATGAVIAHSGSGRNCYPISSRGNYTVSLTFSRQSASGARSQIGFHDDCNASSGTYWYAEASAAGVYVARIVAGTFDSSVAFSVTTAAWASLGTVATLGIAIDASNNAQLLVNGAPLGGTFVVTGSGKGISIGESNGGSMVATHIKVQ